MGGIPMRKGTTDIDGSQGEGGGQLLRNAVALAAIHGSPIRVYNIRRKRKNPGLRPQHLHAVKLVGRLCGAEMMGLKENSMEIQFSPKLIRGGSFSIDIGTAGSITLLLQCVLPVLAFTQVKSTLKITGGTSVKWAPPVPYMTNVFLPILSTYMGFEPTVNLVRRGYYPKGGGLVEVEATPVGKIQNKPVDKHLSDQLIVWMALANGESRIECTELTLHTTTVIELCETIAGTEFNVIGRLGAPATIECHGVGGL